MKLHGDYGSDSTRRVVAVLKHIGLQYELVEIDLFREDNRAYGFLAMDPNGMVPVLQDGPTTLYEAAAINIYLAEKHGSDLLPAGQDRHHVLKWMFWAAEHFRQGPLVLFSERVAKKIIGIPEDPRAVFHAEESIREFGEILDAHLAGCKFVVADRFTLADIELAAPLSQMSRSRLPLDEFPNIMAWHQRLAEEVPAWRQSGELLEERMAQIRRAVGVNL